MNCKRCGAVLPSEGFVCKECGMLMDKDQIASQKDKMRSNLGKTPSLMSVQNGGKIVYNDDKQANKGLLAAVMLVVVVFLVALSLIIFFIKR